MENRWSEYSVGGCQVFGAVAFARPDRQMFGRISVFATIRRNGPSTVTVGIVADVVTPIDQPTER